jgi:methionyl-tRNA synthetase
MYLASFFIFLYSDYMEKITMDDFKKAEIKIGEILSAEKVENADKLLKLSVALGEETPRQIISGIAMYFPNISVLVGKKCAFATNLEPRAIRGLESNGMILAVSTPDGKFSLLEANGDIPAGETIK